MSFTEFLLNSLGPHAPLLAAGFVGILVVLVMLPKVVTKPVDPLDRIKGDVSDAKKSDATVAEKISRYGERNASLAKFAHLLEPQDSEQLSETRKMLIRAGFKDRDAVRALQAAQIGLGFALLVVGLFYVLVLGSDQSMNKIILSIMVPGLVGYYGPRYWVNKRVLKRQEAIVQGFPDALDLLLVCVEAGQSLDQSILRVSAEIGDGFPELADEFHVVAQEIKAGKTRATVLRDFADRVEVRDIASFVTVLIQAQSFGTSIAESLRVYANEMRDKRVMRAEEKANVLPTKLTIGTMLFCLPPLLIILIGPSLVGIAQSLSKGGLF